MDIEDKTRVVPSVKAKRSEKVSQGDLSSAEKVGPSIDATVFVGKSKATKSAAKAPILKPIKIAAASITSLDKTVFSDANTHNQELAHTAVTRTLIKDRFELVSLLGAGGMGAVYRALDRRKVEASDSDPYVAVKLLNEDFKRHPDAFISLQRESRKSQNLAHPNIVTVYDFDRDGDTVFMTMEFLDGSPLDKIIRQNIGKGLEPELSHKILKDVTGALMHAHSQRIVHSDFKPGNIFVTKAKGAKVFDFGIARAVSSGMSEAGGEQTLFDAGSLGALTPAYASLEMLNGDEPCQSDDVYALGCVAYELFTGRHPFNKTPADQAQKKKLKPRRIRQLSRKQWRALERALEFSREKRTVDAAAFNKEFFGGQRTLVLAVAVLVLSVAALGAAFIVQYREQTAVDAVYKAELEQQLQAELLVSRIADKKESISRLLSMASLTVDWERDLRLELKEFAQLAPAQGEFVRDAKSRVAVLFLNAAKDYIAAAELANGDRAISRSESWQQAEQDVQGLKSDIESQKTELLARIAQEESAELARQNAIKLEEARAANAERNKLHAKNIEAVVSRIEAQLRCGFSMDVNPGLKTSLAQLAELDAKKAVQIRPIVAREIVTCLKSLALDNPARTEPILMAARALLVNQKSIQSYRLDFCGHLSVGSGGKGARYTCADKLVIGRDGPALVKVNGEARTPVAIGKYEISNEEFSVFCHAVGKCGDWKASDKTLPAVGVPIETIKQYLAWLSSQSGYQYRLPTYREWFGAASAGGEREQPDRNCYLKYGGIEKGGALINGEQGKSNAYGLVNHVGNASEIVLGDDGELLEVGGNHTDAMSACLATTKKLYSDKAHALSGFRVVRDEPLK